MTLDPGHDTPPVLKPYATGAGADPARWTFLTAEPAAASDFMAQFGIIHEPNPSNPADITHNLRTAVIGADGRLAAVHTGNRWTPDELVADLTADPRSRELIRPRRRRCPSPPPSGGWWRDCARRPPCSGGSTTCPTTPRPAARRCAASAASCARGAPIASRPRSRPPPSSSSTAIRRSCSASNRSICSTT